MQTKRLEMEYAECKSKGFIIKLEYIDYLKIRSIFDQAKDELEDIEELKKVNCKSPLIVFKEHYDVLHKLVQVFLMLDKIKNYNHQCLFVYFCVINKRLGFDFEFLDILRKKRNDVNYYDGKITFEEWSKIRFIMIKYIRCLIEEINKKLNY